eukprot:1174482-Prorocentrum_minimum.AAC.1
MARPMARHMARHVIACVLLPQLAVRTNHTPTELTQARILAPSARSLAPSARLLMCVCNTHTDQGEQRGHRLTKLADVC